MPCALCTPWSILALTACRRGGLSGPSHPGGCLPSTGDGGEAGEGEDASSEGLPAAAEAIAASSVASSAQQQVATLHKVSDARTMRDNQGSAVHHSAVGFISNVGEGKHKERSQLAGRSPRKQM